MSSGFCRLLLGVTCACALVAGGKFVVVVVVVFLLVRRLYEVVIFADDWVFVLSCVLFE